MLQLHGHWVVRDDGIRERPLRGIGRNMNRVCWGRRLHLRILSTGHDTARAEVRRKAKEELVEPRLVIEQPQSHTLDGRNCC